MNKESSIDVFLQELISLCDKHNVQFSDDNYITIQLDGKEVFNGTLGHDKPYKITPNLHQTPGVVLPKCLEDDPDGSWLAKHKGGES